MVTVQAGNTVAGKTLNVAVGGMSSGEVPITNSGGTNIYMLSQAPQLLTLAAGPATLTVNFDTFNYTFNSVTLTKVQ